MARLLNINCSELDFGDETDFVYKLLNKAFRERLRHYSWYRRIIDPLRQFHLDNSPPLKPGKSYVTVVINRTGGMSAFNGDDFPHSFEAEVVKLVYKDVYFKDKVKYGASPIKFPFITIKNSFIKPKPISRSIRGSERYSTKINIYNQLNRTNLEIPGHLVKFLIEDLHDQTASETEHSVVFSPSPPWSIEETLEYWNINKLVVSHRSRSMVYPLERKVDEETQQPIIITRLQSQTNNSRNQALGLGRRKKNKSKKKVKKGSRRRSRSSSRRSKRRY